MPTAFEKCETQARQLPIAQRAQLAEHLINSLEEPNSTEHDQLWLTEVERRHQAYRHQRTKSHPVAEAIQQAKNVVREQVSS